MPLRRIYVKMRIPAIPGDGAGPELVRAVRTVLEATRLPVELVELDHRTTALTELAAAIRAEGVALKGPIATPQDGGTPSLNVGLRRALGLHTQIRRVRSVPGAAGPAMDVHVIRQTTEGLFAGVGFAAGTPEARAISQLTEGRMPEDAAVSLKYVTEAATRRTCELAFELAAGLGHERVDAAHKAAAIPHADGHFLAVAEAVAVERRSRGLAAELRGRAVDALAARLVSHPEEHAVIVTTNLYGDVLSDVAAAVAGSVALTAGANLGDGVATFEAAHGVVLRHAGADTANPLGLLLSAVMLLNHLDEHVEALRVEQAVQATLAAGIGTADLHPRTVVGTQRFAAEVAARLGG
jgi:isocitrate dehydrogenase (NAD+)